MLMKAVSTLLRPVTRRALPRTEWLGSLVREHRSTLVRIAVSEGLTGEEALDAVQEAAMTFLTRARWRSLETKPDDAIRLLATLTRNQARNARRRHGRGSVPLEHVMNRANETVSLDDALQRAREHVTLTGCIQTLKGAQRAVVMARLLDGDSGDDVAQALGLSPGNVAVTLHRARERLRSCVENSPFR
ncbi:MAG: sigma-70 family RNA polymerase sigma factor [Archangium gephyra]|uniref:Sigma-70 family RNA polymerase sigma factor n=1 Tax=Archangium gephyra TaxID=48 RepID=A0A2W5T0P1_9BACT|nr:MAG: sigma-70 family RNA polymerase sigma factor [Archangium gephyra]